jgi:hypothetical protein
MGSEVGVAGPGSPGDRVDTSEVEEFLVGLEGFAATLDARQNLILRMVLLASMDPIERIRWQQSRPLRPEEEALVASLLDQ